MCVVQDMYEDNETVVMHAVGVTNDQGSALCPFLFAVAIGIY